MAFGQLTIFAIIGGTIYVTVTKGRIRLRPHEPINEEQVLDPAVKGRIPPEIEHDVELLDDDTEFYIEFFRGDGE